MRIVLFVQSLLASKRELIDTGTDKRYVRRNEKGQFEEVVDVGKSLSQDRKKKAKTTVPRTGEGEAASAGRWRPSPARGGGWWPRGRGVGGEDSQRRPCHQHFREIL